MTFNLLFFLLVLMKGQQKLQFLSLLLLLLITPFLFLFSVIPFSSALADWEVIFTDKGEIKAEKAVGYKGFQFYEGLEYGIVAREIEGDFELYLYNPGDRLVGKGKKKEKDHLIVFTPPVTEKGYKIVIKGKEKEGKFRLILSQRSKDEES